MSAKDEETYEELIRRAVERIQSEVSLDGGLPRCTQPDCERHNEPLKMRRSNVQAGSGGGQQPCRDDQMWKCCGDDPTVGCKMTQVFGLPIDRDTLDEERRMRGGAILAPENKQFIEAMDWDEEEVMDRLGSLGYIEN